MAQGWVSYLMKKLVTAKRIFEREGLNGVASVARDRIATARDRIATGQRTFLDNLRSSYEETSPRVYPTLIKLFYALPPLKLASLVPENTQIEPPIMEDICLPPYTWPPDHNDYIPLMSIVKARQPRIVVELGTAHGNTVANICRHSPQARVYTVNAPAEEQSGELITYELTRDEIGRVYRSCGFGDRVVQIFKNTLDLDLSEYFAGPVVDLALIDACHDTDYVLNDFFKVQPFMRPQGLVLFHDTHPSMKEHLLGSYMACMKLRRKGFDIRHIEDSWWAVWINNTSKR